MTTQMEASRRESSPRWRVESNRAQLTLLTASLQPAWASTDYVTVTPESCFPHCPTTRPERTKYITVTPDWCLPHGPSHPPHPPATAFPPPFPPVMPPPPPPMH